MVKNLPANTGDVGLFPDRASKPVCSNTPRVINFVKFVYKVAIKKQNIFY